MQEFQQPIQLIPSPSHVELWSCGAACWQTTIHWFSKVASLFGDILFDLYRYDEALATLSEATETLGRVLGPDNPLTADHLANLAYLQRNAGFPLDAERNLERAVAILELYPDSGIKASTYSLMALQRHRQGELIEARRLYEAALEIKERLFGPDSGSVAGVLTNLGWLEKDLGELEEARRHCQRGLEIVSSTRGARSVNAVVFLMHLAEVEQAAGNLEAAERIAREAWAIEESFLDPSRLSLEVAALTLGVILRERGKLAEAEAVLTRVLDVVEAGYDLRDRDLAANWIALADLRVDQGRVSEAVGMYEEALSIVEEIFGPAHPMAAETRLKLSTCASRLGDWQGAFDYAVQAELGAQETTRTMLTGLSERVGLRYASTRSSGLDRILSLLVEQPQTQAIRQAFDVVIRARALVLDEMADRRRTLALSGLREDDPLVAELMRARQQLARLTVLGPGGSEPAQLERFQQLLATARDERDGAERALAEANRQFRLGQRQQRIGLAEVEEALPMGSGLLAFVRYVDPQSRTSYLAFVLRADGRGVELINLGEGTEIDALVERVRSQVAAEAEVTLGSSGARERAYRREAGQLRGRVWDPLTESLADAERLFVVPDGSLHLLSLAALPAEEGEYLLESGPRLHYLSAERELPRAPATTRDGGLLAVGNPDFNETTMFADLGPRPADRIAARTDEGVEDLRLYRGPRSACESFEAMRFEPLPASEEEVEEVVGVWSADSPESECARARARRGRRDDVQAPGGRPQRAAPGDPRLLSGPGVPGLRLPGSAWSGRDPFG